MRQMTYRELAEAWHLELPAAKARVRRRKWETTKGNDGAARIMVPDDADLSPTATEPEPEPAPAPDPLMLAEIRARRFAERQLRIAQRMNRDLMRQLELITARLALPGASD